KALGTCLVDTPVKLPSGTSTIFSNTVETTSKSVSWQIKLPARSASLVPQTQWNLIFTGWCSGQTTPFGHTTPISISPLGATPPSGSAAVPLMNLGKTITLPGSWESPNFVSRTWANAGAASASAGTTSAAKRQPLILNFIVSSFILHLSTGFNTQTLCHVTPRKLIYFFSTLKISAARFSTKNRTRLLDRIRFSGPYRGCSVFSSRRLKSERRGFAAVTYRTDHSTAYPFRTAQKPSSVCCC